MKKISIWISGHVAVVILTFAVLALFAPASFNWMPSSSISPMLGIVMFCMGLTMKPSDFKVVFNHPKDVFIGCACQFTIMPLLAYLLARALNLSPDMAIGVVLVGCCPGGTASNVITYLAKGDVALSIGMTAVSTVIAPLLTPLLVFLLAGQSIDVNVGGMFLSIIQVVFVPILFGFLINHYAGATTKKIVAYLPTVTTLLISFIIACIISSNAQSIMKCSMLLWIVVILHNVFGLVLGYVIGRILNVKREKRIAITIEVGMQNSGLATSLAATHFAVWPMAAVPGAIFSVWHNISGSFIAAMSKKRLEKQAAE